MKLRDALPLFFNPTTEAKTEWLLRPQYELSIDGCSDFTRVEVYPHEVRVFDTWNDEVYTIESLDTEIEDAQIYEVIREQRL